VLPKPARRQPTLLLILVCLACTAGATARLWDLDRMVVWHDEVFTAVRVFGYAQEAFTRFVFSRRLLTPADLLAWQRPSADRDWHQTLAALAEHPEHGPLFYLAARLSAVLVSDPLQAIRGAAAILSLLLLPAMFWLALELFAERTTALIAAALAASSPMQLLYAQEAREYALWAALAAAASAAFLRACRGTRAMDWALYAALMALGLYSHLLFALVMAAHLAYRLLINLHEGRPLKVGLGPWSLAAAAAALLFSPWLWVMATGAERVHQFTGWMARPVPIGRTFENWGMHLVRLSVDWPGADALLLLGLLPLAWVLWRFAWMAPRHAALFLVLLFGLFAAVVLLPDLVFGGSRSLHPRYLMPGFLAVELAVAYVIATAWDSGSGAERLTARAGLAALLALGLASQVMILRADTWWSKNYSWQNHAIAKMINATERPLVLASASGVALGEITSLAYGLKASARIWGEAAGGAPVPAEGFTAVFALTPSEALRTGPLKDCVLTPLLESWQWYQVTSRPGADKPSTCLGRP
jgi:uncharacterized membrane protein